MYDAQKEHQKNVTAFPPGLWYFLAPHQAVQQLERKIDKRWTHRGRSDSDSFFLGHCVRRGLGDSAWRLSPSTECVVSEGVKQRALTLWLFFPHLHAATCHLQPEGSVMTSLWFVLPHATSPGRSVSEGDGFIVVIVVCCARSTHKHIGFQICSPNPHTKSSIEIVTDILIKIAHTRWGISVSRCPSHAFSPQGYLMFQSMSLFPIKDSDVQNSSDSKPCRLQYLAGLRGRRCVLLFVKQPHESLFTCWKIWPYKG